MPLSFFLNRLHPRMNDFFKRINSNRSQGIEKYHAKPLSRKEKNGSSFDLAFIEQLQI